MMVSKAITLKFVDAHVHLSDEDYAGVVEEVLDEAKNSGVVALVSNSMDMKTCQRTLELGKRYPGVVYAALGIHPWTVNDLEEEELDEVSRLMLAQRKNKAFVAVGEIGLDSKYMEIWDKQVKVFGLMLHLAEKLSLPAVIHSRGTTVQVIDMLSSYKVKKVLLHWFSNPISALSKAVERGYYITEGPPAVYSNGIREVVKRVPLTNLLAETDGPVRFFKEPFEGKRTTPSFIPAIVASFAEVKKVSLEEVAGQVLKNFRNLFGIRRAL